MDDLEFTELEILGSEIKRLESDKQRLEEENQALPSTVSELEKANGDLQQKIDSLQSEAERKADSERRLREEIASQHTIRYEELKAAVDRLEADLVQKTDEAEQLFDELQELEKSNREEMADWRRAMVDRADLLAEKEDWEKKMDRVIEENTVIILILLTSQNDLEEHLSRKEKILNTFSARALEIIKDTRRKIEGIRLTPVYGEEGSEIIKDTRRKRERIRLTPVYGEEGSEIIKDTRRKRERIRLTPVYGKEGSEFDEYEDETENVVNVMLWPLMKELNAIYNGFRRIR